MLDNAGGAAQVEPLLPHGSPSVVLVTSRTRLAPIDDATSRSLEPLGAAAGVELRRATTDERVDADPPAARAARARAEAEFAALGLPPDVVRGMPAG
ncbi:hypothetical protein [Dactylosporangium sp. CA-139066]|uniref:hypothetical protein n=1 Tax=Dactylosporangium sp. CA-139066 TaxID=3239930 RepID=UPI003D8A2CF3